MKDKQKQLKIKGKKAEALEDLKPNEQTKPVEGKSNNQSRATIIFNDFINKKNIMNGLYESVDKSNLYFEYVGPTKDLTFCEYMDSKELFNARKKNQLKFNNALKRKKEFLNKINDVKMGKKNPKQKEAIDNLDKFYNSREEVFNCFRDYTNIMIDSSYEAKQNTTTGTGIKILTPKQGLQRLPIAFAQVKAGNNPESLLNEIRKTVYSLYQSKQITEKVYNNIIKSIKL